MYYTNVTVEDITVKAIDSRLHHMFKLYQDMLVRVSMSTKEDTLVKRYAMLNSMDDTTVLLINHAEAIATTDKERRMVASMQKRYQQVMVERRHYVVVEKETLANSRKMC